MTIKPIFIFSVSRSGSTLLQRVLAAHDGIASLSEPWLLLPHAYALRPRGVDAEYPHAVMVEAIEDFYGALPGGREEYLGAVREFALGLYERAARDAAAGDRRYFLDKTPGYALVAREIMQLFPEGKFVFLWRNPLSIAASMIETWAPWHPTVFAGELFVGLPRLIEAYRDEPVRAVHAVRYEDLVGGEARPWRELMAYLEIPFDPDSLERFAQVDLSGRMGDPTGVGRYSALSPEPSEKWKRTLSNPLRREWSRRYLRFLDDERLALIGYDRERLIAELDAQPANLENLLGDIGRMAKDLAKEPLRVRTHRTRIGGPNVIRALLSAS